MITEPLEKYREPQVEDKPSDSHPLAKCAEAWARHATLTFDGKLLRKALKVSAAIMDFCNTLERVNPAVFEHECKHQPA
jgi:hypothetical protein